MLDSTHELARVLVELAILRARRRRILLLLQQNVLGSDDRHMNPDGVVDENTSADYNEE